MYDSMKIKMRREKVPFVPMYVTHISAQIKSIFELFRILITFSAMNLNFCSLLFDIK